MRVKLFYDYCQFNEYSFDSLKLVKWIFHLCGILPGYSNNPLQKKISHMFIRLACHVFRMSLDFSTSDYDIWDYYFVIRLLAFYGICLSIDLCVYFFSHNISKSFFEYRTRRASLSKKCGTVLQKTCMSCIDKCEFKMSTMVNNDLIREYFPFR